MFMIMVNTHIISKDNLVKLLFSFLSL